MKSFASDNNAPVHESVLRAILEANLNDAIAYGDDIHTLEMEGRFMELFGADVKAFPVFNGTGANVMAIAHLLKPWQSVICADKAHIHNDECGAPEKFSGCKVQVLPSDDGKITIDQIKPLLHSVGFQHHVQPGIISITQATELGTLYTPGEIAEIARFANDNDLLLHVDGARLANAAAGLKVSVREMLTETGVDVVSFGGTKNGIMLGEVVVFLNPKMADGFAYVRKQGMQLASKMRYISAQFNALLTNDLWLRNASNANLMAKLLEQKIKEIPEVRITQKVQTNAVFATLPRKAAEKLRNRYFFYYWNDSLPEVRWMTSFHTTEQDIDDFVQALKECLDA